MRLLPNIRVALGHRDGQKAHRWAANELGHEDVGGPSVQLHGGPELLQAPLVQHSDAVPHGHRFHLVVGHINRRCSQFSLQLDDSLVRARSEFGVEIAQRFIHQKYLGIARHGASEGDPLFLSAGQFLWPPLEQFREFQSCLLYTSPSPRDLSTSRMPSSA